MVSKKIIVLKIGSSTLTAQTDRLSLGKIEDLARQIVVLQEKYHVVIVTSGAVAAARHFLALESEPGIVSKQALAAIGQPKLMRLYEQVFDIFGLKVAQCLLTYRDFYDQNAKNHTQQTIRELLSHHYIPIINENDTVAIEELVVGDNDKLSALVASIIPADLLILASDIDGLYDKNPHLHTDAQLLRTITELSSVKQYAEEKNSTLGTGGMTTKLEAAEICKAVGIEMWIVNGSIEHFIVRCLEDRYPFTKFIQ